MKKNWDEIRVERLFELKRSGFSYNEIADILNEEFSDSFYTYNSVRNAFRRNRPPKNKVEFVDKKYPKDANWREFLKNAEKTSALYKSVDGSQKTATVSIDTSEPIGILYSADWHLAHSGVNYSKFIEDMEYLLDHDNLKIVLVGDLTDNFVSFKNSSAIQEQVLAPYIQNKVLESLVDELVNNNKLLVSGYGNHDVTRDKAIIGFSKVEEILSRAVPFFDGKGFINFIIGEETYTNVILHKTRFNSYLHALHGVKREYSEFFPADVIVTAHLHRHAFEMYQHYNTAREMGFDFGGQTFLLRVGTYKLDDSYARSLWEDGDYSSDVIVYFPNEHKKMWFPDMRDAVAYMDGLKQK